MRRKKRRAKRPEPSPLMLAIFGPDYQPPEYGYHGGRPASEVGPPAKIPSGSVPPPPDDRDDEAKAS